MYKLKTADGDIYIFSEPPKIKVKFKLKKNTFTVQLTDIEFDEFTEALLKEKKIKTPL
jgi:hypothetical protein